jgi:hypothetical protein
VQAAALGQVGLSPAALLTPPAQAAAQLAQEVSSAATWPRSVTPRPGSWPAGGALFRVVVDGEPDGAAREG